MPTTITREQFQTTMRDKAVDVATLRRDATVPQPLRDRMAGADMNSDGRIQGRQELGLLYDATDRFDRDRSPTGTVPPNMPTAGGAGLMRAMVATVPANAPVRGLGNNQRPVSNVAINQPAPRDPRSGTINRDAGNVVAYESHVPPRLSTLRSQ